MNAVVLEGAEVGEGSIIAAGAVVLEGTKVGPRELWAGIPARLKKKIDPAEAAEFAQHYLYIKRWYGE
jgi:carbonic anhydrase/acetyltransferase-like protein (isoleucine patch superfamily)